MIHNLLRALASPVGYLIAGYLRPTMGDSAYLVGSTVSSSLVEWLISVLDRLAAAEWWKRWLPSRQTQTVTISDRVTINNLTAWIRDHHPEQVTQYASTQDGELVVTGFKRGAHLMVEGVNVEIGYKEASLYLRYNPREISQNTILDSIKRRVPRNITLRNYYWEGQEWRLVEDILTATRENTFYTEVVEREFVQHVSEFLASRPGGSPSPHKRNYLLWGSPGSGKTSIVRSVLGHLRIFRIDNNILQTKSVFQSAVMAIRSHVSLGDNYVILVDELDKYDLHRMELVPAFLILLDNCQDIST